MSTPPPISIQQLPEGWAADVRAIVRREGQAIRAGAAASLEIQSINTGNFATLMLPTGALGFTTEAERDAVLGEIVNP